MWCVMDDSRLADQNIAYFTWRTLAILLRKRATVGDRTAARDEWSSALSQLTTDLRCCWNQHSTGTNIQLEPAFNSTFDEVARTIDL